MQVVCSNCQLSFQAPDGATGLVCPICRSPLRASDAPAEPESGPVRQLVDWSGGTLDDLVALLSAPAWSARVEVLPAGGGNAVGEVHVIAGGVSDAIHEGKSTHEALDKLRAIKGARFKIEPRLPNPSDGDLTFPGPDQGKLEERPLATLMRYCEDYVLTSGIEVWRGSENAKVDYRRGEIVGVTVGGIDAPERLAEVMKWASGNYRLRVPKLTLPEAAPKAATPAAVVAPRSAGAASKTIFGMPALDPAAIAAATDKVKAAQALAKGTSPVPAPTPTGPSSPSIPEVAARAAATAVPPAAATTSAAVSTAAPAAAASSAAPAASTAAPAATKQSVAKTIFGVQAPSVPPAAAPTSPRPSSPTAPAASARAGTTVQPPSPGAESPKPAGRAGAPATQPQAAPAAAKRPAPAPAGATQEVDRTQPTRSAAKTRPNETPVWTYVGVGFVFGLALLGVYRLVMVLAH